MSAPTWFVRTLSVATHPTRVLRILPALTLTFGAILAACGGGSAREPRTPDRDSESTSSTEEAPSSDSEDSSEAEAEAPPIDPCADGTCFKCGESLCLKGWYCDTAAPSGAACSWLPDCAKSSTCACITKALGSACSCTERDGAPHVSCG